MSSLKLTTIATLLALAVGLPVTAEALDCADLTTIQPGTVASPYTYTDTAWPPPVMAQFECDIGGLYADFWPNSSDYGVGYTGPSDAVMAIRPLLYFVTPSRVQLFVRTWISGQDLTVWAENAQGQTIFTQILPSNTDAYVDIDVGEPVAAVYLSGAPYETMVTELCLE